MDRTKAFSKAFALMAQYNKKKIDYSYNKQFNIWLLKNSHKKEWIKGKPKDTWEFDTAGDFTNVSFSGITKDGFKLTEQDFTAEELKRIKKQAPDPNLLDVNQRKYLQFLINYFETKQAKQTPEKAKPETLQDIITHEKSNEIADRIIHQYRKIKGKRLKLLLLALQELNLIPKERYNKRFYIACKNTFDWDVAKYESMRKEKPIIYYPNGEQTTEGKEIEQMTIFLNSIINDK